MQRLVLTALLTGLLFFTGAPTLRAQDAEVLEPNAAIDGNLPQDEFAKAKVLEILDEGEQTFEDGTVLPYQHLKVRILNGPKQGDEITFDHGKQVTINPSQLLAPGDEIVLGKSYKVDGSTYYYMADRYRLTALFWIAALFVILVAIIAGLRGLAAFLGLAISLVILAGWVVPRILAGWDPLLATLIGATGITFISLYVAHGFTLRTTLALGATFTTLLVAAGLAVVAVSVANLSGLGSEEAYVLQFGQTASIDLRGLLLSGILIGVLGVLDDVTTGQVAAVAEIKLANPALHGRELYKRALNIGREHILSLVNTLVLAYAGASLPVFLFLALNRNYPLWMTLNGEFLAEEIIRTLVGSAALILAVPIATALAASVFTRRLTPEPSTPAHRH